MANFIIVIIGLGSLIALHELGHLLAAKAAGMEVMEYSVGFGPALISKPVGRTVYSLRLIPLGGYVRIGGMLAPKATHEDGYIDEPGHENAFYRKSRTARLLVLASGCFMNLLTAVVIFSVLLYTNGIVPRTDAATMQHVQLSCLEAAGHAVKITGYMVGRIFEHLYLVVTGILPVPGVAGPIGLAKVAGERLAVSNVHFAFFLGSFSVQLAVFNLFPLPVLDGGKIFGLLAEAVLGKRLSRKYAVFAQIACTFCLVVVMALVTIRDIIKLF